MKISKITFEQFIATKLLLPWFVHCNIWGCDTEHEDPNQRVYSYINGLYINIIYKPDGTIEYVAQYENQEFVDENLEAVEIHFWHEFVKYNIHNDYQELYDEVEELVNEFYRKKLDGNNCSGDISPDQKERFDNSITEITLVLDYMLKNNQLR